MRLVFAFTEAERILLEVRFRLGGAEGWADFSLLRIGRWWISRNTSDIPQASQNKVKKMLVTISANCVEYKTLTDKRNVGVNGVMRGNLFMS